MNLVLTVDEVDGLQALIVEAQMWEENRQRLNHAEETGNYPSSNEWEGSDDDASVIVQNLLALFGASRDYGFDEEDEPLMDEATNTAFLSRTHEGA